MYLYKPFLEWNNGQDHMYPGAPREAFRDDRINERHRHIAANGRALTYRVGARRLLSHTFRWLDVATVNKFYDFYDDVVGGQEFVYHTDDSIKKCNEGYVFNDVSTCNEIVSGAENVSTTVTLDQDELTPEDEIVYGYASINLKMREVV